MSNRNRPTETRRALIYCRISADNTDTADPRARRGVDRQEIDCKSLASGLGWQVVGIHIDNDLSASRYARKARPEWARVLERLQAGEADALIAYSLDRLTRSPAELEPLIGLAERGVKIRQVSGELDLTTPEGVMMGRVMVSVAEHEASTVRRRQMTKRAHDRQNGRQSIPVRVFGYRRGTPDDWKRRDPKEARIVAGMVADAIAGASCTEIARRLNARGIKTVAGTAFQSAGVKKIITNPRIAGLMSYRGEVIEGVEVEWDALVPVADWREACTKIAERSTGRRGGERKAPISGVVWCDACNLRMHREGRAYRCKMRDGTGCGRAIAKHQLDHHVESLVIEAVGRDRTIKRIKRRGRPAADVAELRDHLSQIAVAFAHGQLSLDGWQVASSVLDRRIKAAEADAGAPASRSAIDAITSATLAERWPTMRMETRQEIVGLAIDRIEIAKGRGGRLRGGRYFDAGRVKIIWRG
jgi:DNA invertase Pin-like site-specific DNA recombinase